MSVAAESHDEVVQLVELSRQQAAALIPFGGGTSVTGALLCPADEPRTIVSCDTSQMASLLSLCTINLTARVQAGIIGQDLERVLNASGHTCGHEPDSYEFSR